MEEKYFWQIKHKEKVKIFIFGLFTFFMLHIPAISGVLTVSTKLLQGHIDHKRMKTVRITGVIKYTLKGITILDESVNKPNTVTVGIPDEDIQFVLSEDARRELAKLTNRDISVVPKAMPLKGRNISYDFSGSQQEYVVFLDDVRVEYAGMKIKFGSVKLDAQDFFSAVSPELGERVRKWLHSLRIDARKFYKDLVDLDQQIKLEAQSK